MNTQLATRLAELRAEYEAGQKMLAELDAKRQEVRDTMLRISGAIQVLEELAQAQGSPAEGAAGPSEEPAVGG
jgi:prefoldin subunit 5